MREGLWENQIILDGRGIVLFGDIGVDTGDAVLGCKEAAALFASSLHIENGVLVAH